MTDKEWWEFRRCPDCLDDNVAVTLKGSINPRDKSGNSYICYTCGARGSVGDIPSR